MTLFNLQILEQHLNQASTPSLAFSDMKAWFEMHKHISCDIENSITRAIVSGLSYAQLSFVFCGAYQSAMERMFEADRQQIAAFCHTEKGILKPRDMLTELKQEDGLLACSGTKHFVSGGQQAQALYVSAVDENGKLKVLKLSAQQEGIHIKPSPALPFLPELAHGTLTLDKVTTNKTDILEGDGYNNYIKPFRTCEDLHILAALGAYRLKLAWQNRPLEGADLSAHDKNNQALVQSLLRHLLSITALSQEAFSNPLMHLALEDTKRKLETDLKQHDSTFAQQEPEVYALWQRDKALMTIADKAQKARTLSAWSTLAQQN